MSNDQPEVPRTDEETIQAQYPDFTIICQECGSPDVLIENTVGYSAVSGAWGDIALACPRCHNWTSIFAPS